MPKTEQNKSSSLKSHLKSLLAKQGYSDRLQLPPDCGGPSQIILTIGEMVYLDGCQSLISYFPDHITLLLSDGIVTVYGRDLCLKTFSEDQLAICGNVIGVHKGEFNEVFCHENG